MRLSRELGFAFFRARSGESDSFHFISNSLARPLLLPRVPRPPPGGDPPLLCPPPPAEMLITRFFLAMMMMRKKVMVVKTMSSIPLQKRRW